MKYRFNSDLVTGAQKARKQSEANITPKEMWRKVSCLALSCEAMTFKQIASVKEVVQEKAKDVAVYMQDGLLGRLKTRI